MILIGFVIDSCVWGEYYLGEDARVNEYIENESLDLFTSAITLTEIIKFLHQNNENPENIRQVVFEIGILEPGDSGDRIYCNTCRGIPERGSQRWNCRHHYPRIRPIRGS